jgi:C-terminal processing protease CtpA/Prc
MIDHQGVSPDLALPVSERESLNPPPPDRDVQLQKALELLRKNGEKPAEPGKK